MSKCPMCFEELPVDFHAWELSGTGQAPTRSDLASELSGYEVRMEAVLTDRRDPQDPNWQPGVEAARARYGVPENFVTEGEICPQCSYRLPAHWRESTVTCIAMSGARWSGKSLYIAVLVKVLGQYLTALGSSLVPVTDYTARTYASDYEAPLFREMEMMQATPRTENHRKEPLIFSMGFIGGKRQFLVLRDVAGEELENLPERTTHLGFLSRADGIVFMFDPLSVDKIRRRLQGLIPEQEGAPGSAMTVLHNLQVLSEGNLGTTRFAVTLAKFDALQALRDVKDAEWSVIMANPGAGFMRENRIEEGFDPVSSLLVHEEVRALLGELGGEEIVNQVRNPHSGRRLAHRFFAVSSLGDAPQGKRVSGRGISPFRVLDPVLWILREAGSL
ncbi:hypothetical protein [Brevibacterium litoralis]|uniref:hypothetical protein n=1 Tax=Brevibacterium litoralis TaxID=3138935 RepID=UPI0032EF108D